ncbi:NAD(P)H-dependent FMN reductase [Micromonospora haikouensis]|uniref:NAD(P)H-dependent FMN reductase n=1 Tax=Micromonospora haikouensis TaxID=686309 RepID=A0A1C4XKN3_9ACTN|nr:NADPH-dependent FMN reductase [Micromonospora haikouensis]SCF08994.1 NAD(P)H-dependent FMN reductase [Micromonospora haikouensis]
MRILALSGSLRQESFNTHLLRALPSVAPDGMTFDIFDGLGDIPLYNQDLDVAEAPEPVRRWRTAIREADGLVIATPEYNGSIPGVVKNAIDWASRPMPSAALLGKSAVVMVATPGRNLGRNCLADLSRVLHECHAYVVAGPYLIVNEASDRLQDVKDYATGAVTTTFADPFLRRLAAAQLTALAAAVEHDAGRYAAGTVRALFAAPR